MNTSVPHDSPGDNGDGDPAEVPPGGDEPFTGQAAPPPPDHDKDGANDPVDEMSKQSFPTSDPPSTWSGPDQQ